MEPSDGMIGKIRELLLDRRLPLVLACVAVILGLPFLRLGFMVDDYLHRAVFLEPAALDGHFGSPFASMFSFADGDAERTEELVRRGMAPGFTLPEIKLRFWRPLTVATHWVDYALWPNAAWLMHLHSLMWLGAAVFSVALLYRRLMGPTIVAGIAAVLFAIDDTHALPAGWIANRNSLIALVLGASTLIHHDRWRRDGKKYALPLALSLLGLALLAKESSISICAYLFAYAAFLDKGTWVQRMGTLIPYAALVGVWRGYYQWADYGASGSTGYIDPLSSPLLYLRELPARIPLFLNGQFGFPPSDFFTFAPPSAQPYLVAWAAILIAILAPLFAPLIRRDAMARFWATGMVFTLLPICATGTMDRLLGFTGIGAMGLLAQLFVSIRKGELVSPSKVLQRWYRYGYRTLLAIHVVIAPVLFLGMMHLFSFGSGIVIEEVDDFVSKEESVSERTVVIVNAGNYPIGLYLPIYRALREEPAPLAVRSLSGPSIAQVPMTVERVSETSLRVNIEGGFGPSLFRGIEPPNVGERVELPGLLVEVVETRADGWPQVLEFRFDVPLEDPSIIWIEFQGVEVAAWTPPDIGETVFLNDS